MKAEEAVIMVDGLSCVDEPYRFEVYNISKKKKVLHIYDKTTLNEYYCLEYKEEKTEE